MKKSVGFVIFAVFMIISITGGCASNSQTFEETMESIQVETEQGESSSLTDILNYYIDVKDGENYPEYYPAQFELGKTMLSDLVTERGESLPYTGTVKNWEKEHASYVEDYPIEGERKIHSYFYGDSTYGTPSPVIIQAIYLIPFEGEEECKRGCEEFLKWSQAVDPRVSHWELDDLFFRSSQGTFLNKEIGISGEKLKTEIHFGVVWEPDDRSYISDQENCFVIMLRVGSSWGKEDQEN